MMRGLGAGLMVVLMTACASTTPTEIAFQACRWEEGAERDRCIERELADARWDEHQEEVALALAIRKAEHREGACLGQGGGDDACKRYTRFGPDSAAPDPIEVDLSPANPDDSY
ncbi:MAG: hypothetical protein AAF829_02225 [Pseudomonadota bacterium]